MKLAVKVPNQDIQISLKFGMEDHTAPQGGMLWSLEKGNHKQNCSRSPKRPVTSAPWFSVIK